MVILGITFKENCPDTRNTKVIDIVKELREYGIEPVLVDQTADRAEAKRLYGVELQDMSAVKMWTRWLLPYAIRNLKDWIRQRLKASLIRQTAKKYL